MRLNIYVDGSWLFEIQNGVLKSKRVDAEKDLPVLIDFGKLSNIILRHLNQCITGEVREFGDRHCCTSVFNVQSSIYTWIGKTISELCPFIKDNRYVITQESLDKTIRKIDLRNKFANNAIAAGFDERSVIRPDLKPWIIEKMAKRSYQEKQVDTTLVALLVVSAITKPDEYHAVVAGDSDIIPAIKIAYPQYSKNIFVVTTHPHQLKAEHRQSSFSYLDEDFKIPALYLQEQVENFIKGVNVVKCPSCGGIFDYMGPVPKRSLPYCKTCLNERT